MLCETCGWAAEELVWVRPASGGRRKPIFFCCEKCKIDKLAELAQKGFTKTSAVLGRDVFIPIWERNENE
jgi:hypothetical protein